MEPRSIGGTIVQHLFYQGPISEAGVRNVETLLAEALHRGEREVRLCIASNGGDVNAGIGLFNFMRMLPIDVHTHAAGVCASIAGTILLAGKTRTAAPLSVFLLHAATYSEGPLINQIAPNTDLISKPFRDELGWGDAEIADRFGAGDFRFGPDQALQFGLIHSIDPMVLKDGDTVVTVRLP